VIHADPGTRVSRHRVLPGALAILLGLLLAGSSPAAKPPAPRERSALQVFAAASLADAFNELGHLLEQRQPGLQVRLNFAGSQQLATQLEQGAAVDVFAPADQRWMTYATERNLISSVPVTFARNRLVVIVPATNPARIHRLQDLARGGVKLVLGADAVPVGRYSRVVLQNLSRAPGFPPGFASRVLRNVVSEEENVKSVVGKVQLGEADAGMVYRSDVTSSVSRLVHWIEIPESTNVVASYPIAIARTARDTAAARAFVELVLSSQGQTILERHGFMARARPHAEPASRPEGAAASHPAPVFH
jgi:molybdate transport system substrate-binding protein